MSVILSDISMLGFYDFGDDDVIIGPGTVTVGDFTDTSYLSEDYGASRHLFSVNDYITNFPPKFSRDEGNSSKYEISDFETEFTRTNGYAWLEIRTKGTITITGTIDANGKGFVGGDAGGEGDGPYNSSYFGNIGTYQGYIPDGLTPFGVPDVFHQKTKEQVLSNLDPNQNWNYENNRNVVYPGSGGDGGQLVDWDRTLHPTLEDGEYSGAGGSGAGGCGGGVVRIVGDSGVSITQTGKILSKGLTDGEDGLDGEFNWGNIACNYDVSPEYFGLGVTPAQKKELILPGFTKRCFGVIYDRQNFGTWWLYRPPAGTPWTTSWGEQVGFFWAHGRNGSKKRQGGNSGSGKFAPCSENVELAWRSFSTDANSDGFCQCDDWQNEPLCDYYRETLGGTCNTRCCCYRLESENRAPIGGAVNGKNGYGGSGGGVLLRSYGPISIASEDNIDIRGSNGTSNGGTLKIFHTGNLSSNILDLSDTTKQNTVTLDKVKGFYNEVITFGVTFDEITDDSLDTLLGDFIGGVDQSKLRKGIGVQSLFSVASSYDQGNEKVNIQFNEGSSFRIDGPTIKHKGYDIYRAINHDDTTSFYQNGGSNPPLSDDLKWVKIDSITYPSGDTFGPQNIPNPTHDTIKNDVLGRRWIYKNGSDQGETPAWYLLPDERLVFNYTDEKIYDYLTTTLGYTLAQAKEIVQDVLYAKKGLWYWIVPKIEVNDYFVDSLSEPTSASTGRPDTSPVDVDVILDAVESTPFEFSAPAISGRITYTDSKHNDNFYDLRRNAEGNFASGYDDLKVLMENSVFTGSFEISAVEYTWDSENNGEVVKADTYSISSGNSRETASVSTVERTFTDPTQVGRLETKPTSSDPLGYKLVSVSAYHNDNCYELTYPNGVTFNQVVTANGFIVVREREPTPVFTTSAIDIPVSRGSFGVGGNEVNEYFSTYADDNNIVNTRYLSGYENKVRVSFTDASIARTFPISSWYINYDKVDSSFDEITIPVGSLSPDLADVQLLSTSLYTSADYVDPGLYYITLKVEASGSTTGFDLSAINKLYVFPLPPTALYTNEFSSNETSVSAFVPIYFKATDESLAAQMSAVSSWEWSVYDSFDRTSISDTYSYTTSSNILEHNWKWHTDNYELSNVTVDETLDNVCLDVKTNAYGRSGRTDAYGTSALFLDGDEPIFSNDAKCEHIYLYERPPVAALSVLSAATYSSTYSEDSPSFVEQNAIVSTSYVSGYAPFVKVTVQDTSTPKSYPISAYKWNFGDYFNETDNIQYLQLSAGETSSGWGSSFPTDHGVDGNDNYPEWNTRLKNNEVEYTFSNPGEYDVTLTIYASSTDTQRTANLTVEVFEVLPTCDYEVSIDEIDWYATSYFAPLTAGVTPISGVSPLTVYFRTTSIVAGSFPISRLIWDFGDGSDQYVIDRYINNYNNQVNGSDPRGFNGGVISHEYERQYSTLPDNYTVSLSVVAENSNSMVVCSSIEIGPIRLPSFDNVHLIKNRSIESKSDNLYVLQKESDKSLYNIMLSSN